jgi:hypothetical protein
LKRQLKEIKSSSSKMSPDPNKILQTVLEMRQHLAGPHTLATVMEKFSDFKQECPKLFEMVLENSQDYMPGLLKMVQEANRFKNGEASLSEVTKVIKLDYDQKYIYSLPNLDNQETRDYVRKQQMEVEELERKWQKRIDNQTREENDDEED